MKGRLSIDGQPMRLLRYLRDHPGASSLEVTRDLYIVNVTGRVSDLRGAGYRIVCLKRPDGADGYRVLERVVTKGEQVSAW